MTTYFYRYLRPVQFNTQRHSPEALATGGVGFKVLKFTQTAPNDYLVEASIALCSNEVIFNKNVARNSLDGRAQRNMSLQFFTKGLDAESLARGFVLSTDTRLTAGKNMYMVDGAKRYADGIEVILKTHRRA